MLQMEAYPFICGAFFYRNAVQSPMCIMPWRPQLGPVRLLSRAHRSAVDGYLVAEKRALPLVLPLGFHTTRHLTGVDVYTIVMHGEEAWLRSPAERT